MSSVITENIDYSKIADELFAKNKELSQENQELYRNIQSLQTIIRSMLESQEKTSTYISKLKRKIDILYTGKNQLESLYNDLNDQLKYYKTKSSISQIQYIESLTDKIKEQETIIKSQQQYINLLEDKINFFRLSRSSDSLSNLTDDQQ